MAVDSETCSHLVRYSLLLSALILLVRCSHFMGATIRWKSDPDVDNKATFYWKAGWRIGRGPCSDSSCTEADIGRLGTNVDSGNGKDMYCHVGCSGADAAKLANSDYWITAVSAADNYEMGENSFTHTFTGSGPYKVGLAGYAWRSLDVSTGTNDPSWRILTTVMFGERDDTGRPNNSPMTAAFPVYSLQFDCEGKIKLPLLDPDGDTVKCRWGNTFEECGDVCSALPGVSIDEDTCELTVTPSASDSFVDDGWYVGAIILEDFPRTTIQMGGQTYTTSDPLSSVPLAFLIKTPTFSDACTAVPVFVSPTPAADTVYYLNPSESIGIPIYVVNEETSSANIVQIDIVSPSGVLLSELTDDDQGRSGVKYRVAYWTPTATQTGASSICFMALDSNGKYSEYRCLYIYANDVDECLSSPCQNGAVCNNLEDIYTCTCPAGVDGYNCQTDSTDDCSGNSCAAGSTCVDGLNEYTCTCADGYEGQHCDTNIDECASSPCQNGGTCVDGDNSYTCSCVTGYEDTNCETDTDECDGSPCQNSGTCYNLIGDYLCTCDDGYTGSDCQTDIDECASSPCLNGGTCTDNVAAFSCTCDSGWTGSMCHEMDDPCAGTPCANSGTCTPDCSAGLSSAASFSCSCDTGYTGDDCNTAITTQEQTTTTTTATTTPPQTTTTTQNSLQSSTAQGQTTSNVAEPITTAESIDHCASQPCMHGATCSTDNSEYTCTCTDGYEGTECQSDTNECNSSPCLNGGVCKDGIAEYQCTCTDEWVGDTCALPRIEPCSASSCSCETDLAWTGMGLDVSCNCTDCMNGTLSDPSTVLEGRAVCLRNIYVVILAALGGIILTCIVFTIYILVQDLRRRYNLLLNGSDPDVSQDRSESNISLNRLSQMPSRTSYNSVTKVGAAKDVPSGERKFQRKPPAPQAVNNEEDPRALVTEYLLKDDYSSIMFKGNDSNNDNKSGSSYKYNKRNVWSTSDSVGSTNYRNNSVSPAESAVIEEPEEEISEADEEIIDRKKKKHKKHKHKKEHKEGKEKKKESKKERKERKRGWE